MSQFHESADDLLDEVIVRLKSAAVPAYPGPPSLAAWQDAPRSAPVRKQRTRAGGIPVACSAVAMCLAALILSQTQVAVRPQTGFTRITTNPVAVRSIDIGGQLTSLEQQLDRLGEQLQELDKEIATREFSVDASALLAQYSIPTDHQP